MIRPALAAVLSVPVALAVLTGCSSTPAPRATIALPQDLPLPSSPGAAPPRVLPARTVTLTPGQTFAVGYEQSDSGAQWTQEVSGNSQILGQKTTIAHTCTSASAGCGEAATTTYTAKAAGTTTVQWSFIVRGVCKQGPQPCPAAVQSIRVTVQR
jgi:ABC-type uncharacterized transport system auxiliary subunit